MELLTGVITTIKLSLRRADNFQYTFSSSIQHLLHGLI